ncbi:unnamed protein product [Bemisia tabaci]|uniref:Spastin n=1 Tax=Bemisia tabaci TaxID=7038 RepID=A0A9P0ANP6_BEMTA|nr:unnamed protein product [Bemisia tabaci]
MFGKNSAKCHKKGNHAEKKNLLPVTSVVSIHEKNLRFVSLPVIVCFSVIHSCLHFLLVLCKYLWSSIVKLYNLRKLKFLNRRIESSVVITELPCEPVEDQPAAPDKMRSNLSHSVSNNVNELLIKQKEHHRKAFDCITKALKIDEDNGNPEDAAKFYKRGIAELEKGIAVDCSAGRGEVWDKARKLSDKMKTNLAMAKDRLNYLETHQRLQVMGIRNNGRPTLPKSKTLPRSMGSRNAAASMQPGNRSNTPPALKKQLSGPTSLNCSPSHSMATRSKPVTPQKPSNCLKGIDTKHAQIILDEVLEGGPPVHWEDIAGQEVAKQALHEMAILPALRPELFTGLRSPARGLLLFGPPGNGKTLLARAVATSCNATFFSISAASLTSKYVGEGEKLVRSLFAVARELQPSIIFVDEVDSFLSERREGEHEASRRLKTEFLIEFDGLHSNSEHRLLVMAATNRPQELDEAVLRRFTKRIYISLPNAETRKALLQRLLSRHDSPLSERELTQVAKMTEGYSGSDLTGLAKDAALAPIRELQFDQVKNMDPCKVRKITFQDFVESLKRVRRSVSPSTLTAYEKWNQDYGDISL